MTEDITINGARGEVLVQINGQPYRLCLTLGALAEIETALGCVTLEDLEGRLKSVSASEVVSVVQALLRGGGQSDAAAGLAARALDAMNAANIVLKTFRAASQ